MTESERFHVVIVNSKTKRPTRMTVAPMTKRECETNASKLTRRAGRTIEVWPAEKAPALTPDRPPMAIVLSPGNFRARKDQPRLCAECGSLIGDHLDDKCPQ